MIFEFFSFCKITESTVPHRVEGVTSIFMSDDRSPRSGPSRDVLSMFDVRTKKKRPALIGSPRRPISLSANVSRPSGRFAPFSHSPSLGEWRTARTFSDVFADGSIIRLRTQPVRTSKFQINSRTIGLSFFTHCIYELIESELFSLRVFFVPQPRVWSKPLVAHVSTNG